MVAVDYLLRNMASTLAGKVVEVFNKYFEFTKIGLDKDNRMLRAGIGKHQAHWFARVDLWCVGLRIAKRKVK